MALLSQSIPALYGGVSQQAAVSRSITQCEEAENCSFSLTRGVSKRPPLECLSKLQSADLRTAFFHWSRIDNGRWFVTMIPGDGTYTVFDAETGDKITSSNDTGQAYLTTTGRADRNFFAVDLEGKVYVVNREIAVQALADVVAGSIAGSGQTLQDSALDGAAEDSIWEILGSDDGIVDNYYVKKIGGKWYEWHKPGEQYKIDPATMPHTISIDEDGGDPFGATADFQQEQWADRLVGDVDSNKFPSFVGFPIDSLFFKSDRLGILSGQSFSCSRTGEYHDFWRSSVTAVLDDDRIDQKVNAFEVSKLYYAETVGKSLVLFANERQFTVDGFPIFSPNTVQTSPITAFPTSEYVRPVSSGPNVFFNADAGEFSHLREMFIQEETVTMDAANVSSHVPRYVPKAVRTMGLHPSLDQVLIESPETVGSIYSYEFYWQGNEKALSAWGVWTPAGAPEVMSFRAIGPSMHCVYHYEDSTGPHLFLGKFNLKDGDVHEGFEHKILLDHVQKVVPTYNGVEDRTYFVTKFPMMHDGHGLKPYLVRGQGSASLGTYETDGNPWTFTKVDDNQFYLNGDWTGDGDWWIGLPYTMRFRFSEIYYFENQRPVLHARTQVRSMAVHFEDTAFFRVDVKVRGHDQVQSEVVPALTTAYTSRTVGDEYFQLNTPQLVTGTFQFPVLSRASDAIVELVNDSPLPCHFQSAEWKGLVSTRTPR